MGFLDSEGQRVGCPFVTGYRTRPIQRARTTASALAETDCYSNDDRYCGPAGAASWVVKSTPEGQGSRPAEG